ncbi:MAG: DUF2064 domain-containing protein [Wenzhouxiangellaceae bacterium]
MSALNHPTVIVFCKRPHAGTGKQRLAAGIGVAPAQRIAEALLECALEDVRDWPGQVVIAPASADDCDWAQSLHATAEVMVQTAGNLGQRLQHIDECLLRQGCAQRIFIGTDAPLLSAQTLQEAATALQHNDVVLQPALDGGVTLMATGPAWPGLSDLPWSQSGLGVALQASCLVAGHSVSLLPAGMDIDVLEDLQPVQAELQHDPRPARRQLRKVIAAVLANAAVSMESTA